MRKIKAVFIDMDGTLLTRDNNISDRNYQAVQTLKKEGVLVFLATGRQLDLTYPYHQALKLTTPMICLNGAAVYEWLTPAPLLLHPLQLDSQLLYQLTDLYPSNLIVHAPDGMYCKEIDDNVSWWVKESGHQPVYSGDLREVNINNALKYSIITGAPVTPFIHCFQNEAEIIRWDNGFELVQKYVSKWSAIEFLLKQYDLKPNETAAFGDGPNDIEMIASSGIGVAMGNAELPLKNTADFITLHHEDDGLAYFIENHILQDVYPLKTPHHL